MNVIGTMKIFKRFNYSSNVIYKYVTFNKNTFFIAILAFIFAVAYKRHNRKT